MKKYLIIICLFLCSYTFSFAQNGQQFFDNEQLHTIELFFPEVDFWDSLVIKYFEDRSFSGSDIVPMSSAIKIDGQLLDTVGVRLKGKSAFSNSPEFKKPFKIDLNEYDTLQTYDGLKKFNLHNGACDPSFIRDLLSFDLHRQLGLKVPRVAHCKLYINDQYWGVYAMIEQIDKTFLEQNFSNKKGNLYKNNSFSDLHWEGADKAIYKETFELKTNREEDQWDTLIEFLDVLNNTPDSLFEETIQEVFDVDSYLKTMAVDVVINNWDSYLRGGRNWYLYHNPATDLIEWIPWDYNLAWGGDFDYFGNPYQPLNEGCELMTDYAYSKVDGVYQFSPYSNQDVTSWHWDFGDGFTSTEQFPTMEFASSENPTVCLTVENKGTTSTCQHTRCKQIDLAADLADCKTIIKETSPHAATDSFFQQLVSLDPFCCEVFWDSICDQQYALVEMGESPVSFETTVEYEIDLPLFIEDSTKVMINRLLAVPLFKERYLDYVCLLTENYFTQERIQPMIDQHADLLREAIYEDPYYIFTRDWFEFDVGNGTGGGFFIDIPSINRFMEERVPRLQTYLAESGYDCGRSFSNLEWHDLVINEFVASNIDSIDGVADENSEYDDWIELYNNSDETIDLSKLYLSDKLDDPKKWSFPLEGTIAPGGYLILWADKDEMQGDFHTNFKLSADGESLILSHADGTVLDSFSYQKQLPNVASARIPNGTGNFVSSTPTFEQSNGIISSTEEVKEEPFFQVYPNPSSTHFRVDFLGVNLPQRGTLLLRNIIGEVITTKKVDQHTIDFSTTNLSAGIYFLELKIEEVSFVKKVVVSE